MKYIVLVSLLFIGCGDDVGGHVPDCEVFSEDYSHSVVFCDGDKAEHVSEIFVACNPRTPPSERPEDCVTGIGLMDWGCGCEVEHICWSGS